MKYLKESLFYSLTNSIEQLYKISYPNKEIEKKVYSILEDMEEIIDLILNYQKEIKNLIDAKKSL